MEQVNDKLQTFFGTDHLLKTYTGIPKIMTEVHLYYLQLEQSYIHTFHGSISLSQDNRMWNKS
jgi:hypothetical protein